MATTSNDPVRPGCFKMALNLALASSWSRLLHEMLIAATLLHAEPHEPFAAGQWAKVMLFEGARQCQGCQLVSRSAKNGRRMRAMTMSEILCFWETSSDYVRFKFLDLTSYAHSHDRIIHHGHSKLFRSGTDNARASSAGLAQADHQRQ